ncbi:MFS siderochrome iron transporter 1 [Cladophialophora chaetospira]|uniref:MFS siderochrome iron transporter 1 n=1 Tax=Cladophialophora chaetospira TaxID=386627 RepID=A0AA39CR52_9EURO|nr:MFS siderochrome iron transporter 1 [Cladophialophora chaetospira]
MRFSSARIRPSFLPVAVKEKNNEAEAATQSDDAKEIQVTSESPAASDSDAEAVDKNAQVGVQKIEATTSAWSKHQLILAYALIFLIFFVDSMQQQITGTLTPYVTSSFQLHSLTATTGILSQIIGGLSKLPLAKILDIWGRPQGFLIMVSLLTIGLVMMAACKNVETYAAAQVFYWVGYNGIDYSLSIFIADTSHLKNRGLMYGFASSPYIVTTWIGGPAAQSFLDNSTFRWGFGTFAIITPFVCSLLFILFIFNYRKAKKAGLMPARESTRTILQSVRHHAVEFDLFGLLLITSGLALFLLPFSLYSYQPDGWRSPMIICMVVFGGLLLIAFGVWEARFTPVPFIPWTLLTDRTVFGANILAAVLFVSFYIWNSFFYSFLVVVNNQSITHASYITNIYSIVACFFAIPVGLYVRWSGRFKNIALFFGVPITILGVALMLHFRQPDVNIGYIAMCQVFIAVGGGVLVICEQIAVMAAASHQHVAVVLAIEGMFSSVGGAIGSTIATAIWTGNFRNNLLKYLPASAQGDVDLIYGDLTTQTSYAWGSPTRDAINRAYGDTQRLMLIASTAFLALAVVAVAAWRNIYVKDIKQVRGRVA